jgi:hypothetical protein
MSFISSSNVRAHLPLALCLVMLSPITAGSLTPSVAIQGTSGTNVQVGRNCQGLHAGIRAEFVKGNDQHPSVMVSFILLNDEESIADTTPGSWKLNIDGKELSDSTMIFGNGPAPTDGWRTLNPGGTAQFGKALDVSRYFPEAREYKIFWNGAGFRSPTTSVKVPANRD